MKNYYKILGLPQTATLIEIRKAYRSLALKFHPDCNKDEFSHEKFISINEAYCVLKDFRSKVKYDELCNFTNSSQDVRSNERFQARQARRNEFVYRKSEKGREKGNSDASKPTSKIKSQNFWSGLWDVFSSIVEFFGTIFSAF